MAKEGAYKATATATDVYGNELSVTIMVYAGTFIAFDSVLATVLTGASVSKAKTAFEAAPVCLRIEASPAFEGDAAKITWDFDGLGTKLADAKADDNIAMTGTY